MEFWGYDHSGVSDLVDPLPQLRGESLEQSLSRHGFGPSRDYGDTAKVFERQDGVVNQWRPDVRFILITHVAGSPRAVAVRDFRDIVHALSDLVSIGSFEIPGSPPEVFV